MNETVRGGGIPRTVPLGYNEKLIRLAMKTIDQLLTMRPDDILNPNREVCGSFSHLRMPFPDEMIAILIGCIAYGLGQWQIFH